jgi:dimethylhistidine N-methyltransferase
MKDSRAVAKPVATVTSATGIFRADVLNGLRQPARELPCKYFYDAEGSRLFEEICELQEYYLTRTELAIMRLHAAAMAECVGPRCLLIEYGSGSSLKTRLLLDRLADPAGYVPVDLSCDYLHESAQNLAKAYPRVAVSPLCADFTVPFAVPSDGKRPARRVVYFPGSTIGNFTKNEAVTLLRQTARRCGPGGGLLLGADLKKDPAVLHAAYNDSNGVTAAFNRNLLVRINRELSADFQVDQFWHHAFYDPREGRIEMHLVSQCDQQARLAGDEFRFAQGETIRTEFSHKYTLAELQQLAEAGRFETQEVWVDERRYFTVQYLSVR